MKFEEETSYAGSTYTGRILKETKAGFLLGVFCGLFSHPVKGICNLPKNGLKPLLKACPQAALTNVPRLGGKFAAFTAVWSSLTCAMDHYQCNQYFQAPRLKTAVLSPVIGLTATVALCKSPRGFLVASRSAIRWGSVYAIFRGSYEIGAMLYGKYYFDDIRTSNMYQQGSLMNFGGQQGSLMNFGGRMVVGGLYAMSLNSNKEALDEEALEEED